MIVLESAFCNVLYDFLMSKQVMHYEIHAFIVAVVFCSYCIGTLLCTERCFTDCQTIHLVIAIGNTARGEINSRISCHLTNSQKTKSNYW